MGGGGAPIRSFRKSCGRQERLSKGRAEKEFVHKYIQIYEAAVVPKVARGRSLTSSLVSSCQHDLSHNIPEPKSSP